MKRLYLLRHTKASPGTAEGADRDRPLAPRGITATERLTRYLHGQGARPNVVLCSSARRARQTLDGISAGLEGDPDVAIEADLYCASTWELLERVRKLPAGVDGAMLIGHNPGLHDLALLLAGEAAHSRLGAFPPGALVTLELRDDDWSGAGEGACSVTDFVVPKELP